MLPEMSQRFIALTVLTMACVLGIVGCDAGPEDDGEHDSFQVRLLTSTPVSGRWERAAEMGLGRIAAEFDASVVRLRAATSLRQRTLVAEQGESGVDLVFCVGAGFENAVYSEAPSFPGTRFVLLPGRGYGPNVGGIEIVPDGAAWVAGVVAASLSSSKSVGVVRGAGGPWLDHVEGAFIKGFLSTSNRRNVVVVSSPEGPWELVERGVKVALYATDLPEAEVYAAAHDAGLLLVATDDSMIDDEPDLIVAAVTVDVAEAMIRLTREVVDGIFTGGIYAFDLGSGVLDVRLNPTMVEANLPSILEALERARSEVTAGIVEMEELGI